MLLTSKVNTFNLEVIYLVREHSFESLLIFTSADLSKPSLGHISLLSIAKSEIIDIDISFCPVKDIISVISLDQVSDNRGLIC